MKQGFFNIIPGPAPDSCCVLLYGEIGEWGDATRSADFVRELMEAAAVYKKIDVRINSTGGEVHPAIAIINAILNCNAEITIYIDAIAASAAAMIAVCGRRVEISQFGRMMFHSVRCGVFGNKGEIASALKEVEALETTLCDIIAKRINQTPEQIRETYFDGKDHWLTAQEALSLGFVDAIYEAEPVPADSTPDQVYHTVLNRLNVEPKNTTMIEKLRKRPSFANCATDEDVLKRVEEIEAEAAKVPGLEQENTTLREAAEARRVSDEAAADAAIDAELETAVSENRITEPEKAEFKAMFKAAPDVAKAQLARRKPAKRAVDVLKKGDDPSKVGAWEQRWESIREKNNQK